MSRFSKIPVKVPEDVKIEVTKTSVKVTGLKGTLERQFPEIVEITIKDGELFVASKEVSKFGDSIRGTIRSHIVNMVKGVTVGWNKKLELVGTGFRSELKGNDLVLTVGFSHTVLIAAPSGIKFVIEKNIITIEGSDKEVVGAVAAKIKEVRRPDPYKGKGIKYVGEVLKLKPGKQAAKTGGAA